MLRRITYRTAANAFIFTGLWFVIGAIVLWSPIPGALGIGRGLFGAWVLLFFVMLACSGSALTIAAMNGAFGSGGDAARAVRTRRPSTARPGPPRRHETLWAPPHQAGRAPEQHER